MVFGESLGLVEIVSSWGKCLPGRQAKVRADKNLVFFTHCHAIGHVE